MTRASLTRKTPLERRTPLRNKTELKRTTPLRRSRPRKRLRIDSELDPVQFAACWFASVPGSGPCRGTLVRCHLLPQALLRRHCGEGWERYALDPRSWVPGCGGLLGIAGHHGQFDSYRLTVQRHMLPPEVEDLAAELGLLAWLDRRYGALECAA